MDFVSKDILNKLEYDKIIEIASSHCFGDLGRKAVCDLKPHIQFKAITTYLAETSELLKILGLETHFKLGAYEDVSEYLKLLRVEDYVLETTQIRLIYNVITIIAGIDKFFTKEHREKYPNLYFHISKLEILSDLLFNINKILDEKGYIKSNASPELVRIRAAKASKIKELDRQFRKVINDYKTKGWLTDNEESYRNGRRVLSVPAEHKRKIRGIIHDESATGKTAFIEPEKIIEINNDLFDLDSDEKREVYRLLKELCNQIRPYIEDLADYQQAIVNYDVIWAKANLASSYTGVLPKLVDKPTLGVKEAVHPLLYLKNLELGKETIPFSMDLHDPNRLLVISGPNAGGKSVCMKSVGLLQLLLQAGFLLPVDENSEFGIFESMFTDIGDEQSIEDDLSTYSSRLKNMKRILDHSNDKSLVLIDEFGSGTDPKLGGAIAEALLKELNHRRSFGVITTHYSNLKIFAFKTKGIVNGAMLFDDEKLTPTYMLKIGRPGSSFAFEIAEKSGLNNKVMKYAKFKAGKNAKAVEELLVELQSERKQIEDQLKDLKEKEAKLEKLIKNYEVMNANLTVRRKKLKLSSKEIELQQKQRENKDLNKLIKELKDTKDLEKAEKIVSEFKAKKEDISKEVKVLKEEIYEEEYVDQKPIEAGDFVKLMSGGSAGRVERIKKGKAIVMMGLMKMTVDVKELIQANEPLEIRSKSVKTNIASTATFESKLDIRGLRREEALQILEVFVDKAIMTSVDSIRIIHGKGNGILRQSVIKKLKEYSAVSSCHHPAREQGGEGVTIAMLS